MVWWLLLLQLFGLFLLTHVLTESQKLIISLSNSPKSITGMVLDYTIVNPPQQICYGYHKHSFKRISENELDK